MNRRNFLKRFTIATVAAPVMVPVLAKAAAAEATPFTAEVMIQEMLAAKHAGLASVSSDYVRRTLRENSFMRQIIPVVKIENSIHHA
jgi:hypothetical protein